MHILQIYKDYAPVVGGIENHVRDLSELLAARGHHVTVLVASPDRASHVETPRPQLTVLKAARLAHAASTPISPAMLAYARAAKPDVIHLHFPFPPGDLAAHAVPGSPPLVITYHSDIVRQQTLLRVYRPLMEATLRRATRIIATSPPYIESSPVLRRYAKKCTVVPLGIDTERFRDSGFAAVHNTIPTVLFVGRLRYYKGLHVLMEAMVHVHARLIIAGSGPERQRLQTQAQALGIGDRVLFLGDVADATLPGLYHHADMFVFPAHLRAEAFGIAQLEALASGLPCISTELGTGTSYVNIHGETGLVVAPDDARALAGAINTLTGSPALRKQYGMAARQRALGLFSHEAMVAGVEQVYREAGK